MLQTAVSQTDSDMEQPQGCLNMPSGLFHLAPSKWLLQDFSHSLCKKNKFFFLFVNSLAST